MNLALFAKRLQTQYGRSEKAVLAPDNKAIFNYLAINLI